TCSSAGGASRWWSLRASARLPGRKTGSGLTPGRAQPVPVADPEDRGREQQHHLVEGARNRQQPDRDEPAQPARHAAVAREQAHGGDGATDEAHAAGAIRTERRGRAGRATPTPIRSVSAVRGRQLEARTSARTALAAGLA